MQTPILKPNEQVITNPMQAIQIVSNQLGKAIAGNKGELDAKIAVMVALLDESIPGFEKSFNIKMTEAASINLHIAHAQSQTQGNLGKTKQLADIIEIAKEQAIELGAGNANPAENPYLKAFWDGKGKALMAMTEGAEEEV